MINLTVPEILSIALFVLLIFPYLFYPIILWFLSKLLNKPVKCDKNYKPAVTFILSVYNEDKLIKDTVESVFQCGYPSELLNFIVGSDGSTDKTCSIVKEMMHKYKNLQLFEFPRSGKNFVLNQIVPKAQTDLILYIDADTRLLPNSLDKFISNFADESIGSVLASVEIYNNEVDSGTFGESLYQKLEAFIRTWEGSIISNTNTLSALYGIKRELYSPLPNDVVCDDMYYILNISLHRKRVIFDNLTKVLDVRRKSLSGEMKRRIRFVAGGLAAIWSLKRLLLPDYGWVSFFLVSHKLLRYSSPLFLIGLIICTFLMPINTKFFLIFAYGQVILYLFSLIGWFLEKLKIYFILFKIPLFFLSINIGFLLGIVKFIKGTQNSIWDKVVQNT
jgi:biofilm PGA synthesis N-glycosyltransferase PgaC